MTEQVTYGQVNAAWPRNLPAVDMKTAYRRACQLTRAFGVKSSLWYGTPRRSWASTEETRNDEGAGWRNMVHDVSHWVLKRRHNNMLKTHSPVHARLELEMIQYVLRKGWTVPKVKVKPTLAEKRAKELARTQASIRRWQTKALRAKNALKKLAKKEKRLKALLPTTQEVRRCVTSLSNSGPQGATISMS